MPHENTLYVGVGQAVITPPIGTIIQPYGGRRSESVGDDLTVSAVAFRYGEAARC